MKTRRSPVTQPRVLDLDTLGRIVGGAGRAMAPSDPSLAIAAADAWSSLSGGFDRAQLATDFMRSHLDDGNKSSEHASWSPVHALRAETQILDDQKVAIPELHCGTMQVVPVNPSDSDEQPTMPRAELASPSSDETVR